MVKQVAAKTSDVAGGGTTTATVLAEAMVLEGMKDVVAGLNPIDLKHRRGRVAVSGHDSRARCRPCAGRHARMRAGFGGYLRALADAPEPAGTACTPAIGAGLASRP